MDRTRLFGSAAAVVLLLLAMGVEGRGFASFNETRDGAEKNQATFRALLDSGVARANAVESCVGHIRNMRLKSINERKYSFPGVGFVPEGAREWCECIVANPPDLGDYSPLSTYPDFYNYGRLEYHRSRVPDGLRAAYDASFDQCRAQVIDGSNINTVDICRGMFSLFGRELNTLAVSFCGRLCPELSAFHSYAERPDFEFNHDCSDPCAREAMLGYCSNTLLEYSNVQVGVGYGPGGSVDSRRVNVLGQRIFEQRLNGAPPTAAQVNAVCSAMAPTLGGPNECCNYAKGFTIMQQCCVLNGDGQAVFDCSATMADELYSMCTYYYNIYVGGPRPTYHKYCRELLDIYRSNAEYAGTLMVFGGDSVKFPNKILKQICENDGYDAGTVCCYATGMDFVANCNSRSGPYTGPVIPGPRPTLPTPGAPEASQEPCHGLCCDERDCVVTKKGLEYCVECAAILNDSDDQCCEYNEEKKKCASARKGLEPGKCQREDELFVINEDGDRQEAVFRRSTGNACAVPTDFRRNGKACRVLIDSAGKPYCK